MSVNWKETKQKLSKFDENNYSFKQFSDAR